MIFHGVTLPDELRIALEEGTLVVFAGAGVSCPPPALLPTFNDLVRELAGLAKDAPISNPEQILGGMVRDKKQVHEAAAKRLLTNTKPTDLHCELVRLFGDPAKVRIVTTNFDNHFTDAANEVFPGKSVREFHAPALPLGDDFEGIIYLHGAARLDPKKLVLTDEDFGKAYLTRGWARDFLIRLFSKFTVVFVGYSHSDIIVSYLARGMNPAEIKPRWAFAPADIKSDEKDKWRHLDIQVATYPRDAENLENKHQPLTDFVREWAAHQQRSLLDHSAAAIAIARGLPPEGDAEAQYVAYCLNQPQLAHDFCSAITHPAWIRWMEKKGLFEPFFTDTGSTRRAQFPSHQAVLGYWLCTYVREKHPGILFDLIRRNHGVMSSAFANMLGHALFSAKGSADEPHFAAWIALLIQKGEAILDRDFWGYLLGKCRIPDHTSVALQLFESLSMPHLHVEKYWSFPPEEGDDKPETKQQRVDFGVRWKHGADHPLREAWQKVLRPHLATVAEPLVALATRHLLVAHELLRSVGKAKGSHDSLSWSISSIAPHEQNRDSLHYPLSLLVEILRDLLAHWFKTNRARALGQMDAWWASESPLLHRLVIYGITVDAGRTPDEKLTWVLEQDLIFAYGKKKEVFDLIKVAYAGASVAVQGKVIDRMKLGPTGAEAEKLGAETKAYESFNALQWLSQVKPDCVLVAAALKDLSAAHPKFGVRDHPEFDSWHGEARFIDPKEGFNFDQILSEPAEKYLNDLLAAKESAFGKDRWTYLRNLSVLFQRDRAWGHSFMEAAAGREIFDADLWQSTFSGWREVLKTAADWEWMLDRIESLPVKPTIYSGAVYLLEHGLWKDELKATERMADRGLAIVMNAWDSLKAHQPAENVSGADWLTTAINHPGGWIGESWVQHWNHIRKAPGGPKKVPGRLRAAIIEAVQGRDATSAYARIAMTPFIAFLFDWDAELVKTHFLPLFDWKRDAIAAQQTWSVVLNYERGRSLKWEELLIPYYRQCAQEMAGLFKQATEKNEQFDSHALRSLGWHLSNLAIHAFEKPPAFLNDILPLVPEITLVGITDTMGDWFTKLSPAEQATKWNEWVRDYWEKRVLGMPVSIGHDEANEFVTMCLAIGDLFPDAVRLALRMPIQDIWVHSVLEKLESESLLEKFPDASCQLLVRVLRGEQYGLLDEKLVPVHAKISEKDPESACLKELEELMYKRGWKK